MRRRASAAGNVQHSGKLIQIILADLAVAHLRNKTCKLARLHGQIAYGLGSFGHSLGCLARHFINFNDCLIDFFAGGRLLLAGSGNGVGLIGCNICGDNNLAQGLPGEAGALRRSIDLLDGIIHRNKAFRGTFLDGAYHPPNICC